MKRSLQSILIAPDPRVRLAIMLGKKRLTIREGHRDYTEGPVMICCDQVPWAVKADIVSVRHTTLAEVTKEEMAADGYPSHKVMLDDLHQYYSAMAMTSPVTVITWGDLYSDSFFVKRENIYLYAKKYGILAEVE